MTNDNLSYCLSCMSHGVFVLILGTSLSEESYERVQQSDIVSSPKLSFVSNRFTIIKYHVYLVIVDIAIFLIYQEQGDCTYNQCPLIIKV